MMVRSEEAAFTAQGSRGGALAGSSCLVVFGVVGSITMLIVAFAARGLAGPPWLWGGTLVGSIAFAVWSFRRNGVTIRVVADGAAGARLVVDGPAVRLDVTLAAEREYWVSFVPGPHAMAKKLVQYNAVLVATDGRRFGFWNLSGEQGSEPADWPVRGSGVSDCDDLFLCPSLVQLARVAPKVA